MYVHYHRFRFLTIATLADLQLLFNSRVIPIKAKYESINPAIRSANAQGLRNFSTFLPTLPALATCLASTTDKDIPWPSFTTESADRQTKPSWETGTARPRDRETCLLNGVVEGLEVGSDRFEAPGRETD